MKPDTEMDDRLLEFNAKPYYFKNTLRKRKLAKLSFDPISKNIRFLSSTVAINWLSNKSTKFSNKARNGEERFVKNQYGWENWYPWIYARQNSTNVNNLDAWRLFFTSFSDGHVENNQSTQLNIKRDKSEMLKYTFPAVVSAINTIFKISLNVRKEINSNYFCAMPSDPVIGLHMRRGEIISEDESWTRPGTPVFSIDDHAHAVRMMSEKLGTNKVFVATDSNSTIEKIVEKLPDFEVFTSNTDRNNFYRIKPGEIFDMQNYIYSNPEKASFYVHSSISDLKYLSQCQGLVGKFSSEFTFTAWLLAIGVQNKMIPFCDLHGDQTEFNYDRIVYQ
jgi:hypothetical protein